MLCYLKELLSIWIIFFKCNLFLWFQSKIFSIITPVFSVTWSFRNHSNVLICSSRNIYYYCYQYLKQLSTSFQDSLMNVWMMHLYSALLCIFVHPKSFLVWSRLSSITTGVQHLFGWCDGCHRTTAPVRSPHTSYRWRGERVIEPIKCMHSPHTSYRWRGESHRANQVDALSTHQLQVEKRESHRANQVYALTTHQLQVEKRESHRANQVYALTTHQLQVERRESHRTNQVYALTTHQLQVERRERVIEPIKCMRSPHTSYRWRGERVR